MSEVFREKSMERVNSPEQLNDYIRVANPGVWAVLGAVIVLLLGVCVWGIFGHLDTTLGTYGVCADGTVTCYVSQSELAELSAGTVVSIGDAEFCVREVASFPVRFGEASLSAFLPADLFAADEAVYAVTISAPELEDGVYELRFLLRRETPISFLLN